jgi:NTE family protein
VPVVLTPVTLNNYGGSCGYAPPNWMALFIDAEEPPRPAARATRHLKEENEFSSAERPYLHLVDGGISDNLGMRAVLDSVEVMEALHLAGERSPFDNVRRIIVFIVNSVSVPKTEWDKSEEGPGTIEVLLKSAGVPIDNYSYEATELLKDKQAHWNAMRNIRNSAAFAANKDPAVEKALRTPDTTLYAIDVSFADLADPAERAYLNELPTSFVLTDEGVDRLRAAAGKIIETSPDFKKLLKDLGAKVVVPPVKP